MSKVSIKNCVQATRCDAKWENLQETSDLSVRFCTDCQKDVHLCKDDQELATAIQLKRCAAINKSDNSSNLDYIGGLWTPPKLD